MAMEVNRVPSAQPDHDRKPNVPRRQAPPAKAKAKPAAEEPAPEPEIEARTAKPGRINVTA